MRSRPGVEDWVVFEHNDRGFDGVHGGATSGEHVPPCLEGPLAAAAAVADGVVRDAPRPPMHDEGRGAGGGFGEWSQASVYVLVRLARTVGYHEHVVADRNVRCGGLSSLLMPRVVHD